MRKLIAAPLIALLLTSCAQKLPTYQLVVGNRTVDLPVHKDPKQIQDDIIANIKPLWDKLDRGTSEAFQYRRVFPWGVGHELAEKARAKVGDKAEFCATRTAAGALLRFYKNRDGISGIEQVEGGKKPAVSVLSGNSLRWSTIDAILRERLLNIQSIQRIIQTDDEQDKSANR